MARTMLTKKTSEKVLAVLTDGIKARLGGRVDTDSPYWPASVVAVERCTARREWRCYFVDNDGRMRSDTVEDVVSIPVDEAAVLYEAVSESESGGIDPAALLATDEAVWDGAQLAELPRRETTTTTIGDIMRGSVSSQSSTRTSPATFSTCPITPAIACIAAERDRAAARWSAQVRAKVKERDETRRADVAVRCQGEED